MSWEQAARLAWAAPALTFCLEVAFFAIADYPDAGSEGVEFLFLLTFMTYSVVGALIASRHPRNPVGWLFCFVGVFFAGSEALYAYARDPTGPAGADTAAWVQSWTGEPVAVVVVLLVLLFPDGRFLSPRWRRAGLAALAAAVVWAVALALDPGPLQAVESISNPFGVEAAAGVLDAVAGFGPLAFAFSIGLAVAGVIVRFRRARARERRQLKWLALGAGYLISVMVVTIAVVLAVNSDEGAWDFVTALLICSGIAALPVAAALAILRDRLYDIDVVINRALVYGALTGTLVVTYLAVVLLIGLTVGRSGLAVAVSTLAVAALFRPARARIQEGVDRRFFRHRYDAAQTLADFGARVRDEVELDALSGDLRQVVRESVQPAHVSLWLRRPG